MFQFRTDKYKCDFIRHHQQLNDSNVSDTINHLLDTLIAADIDIPPINPDPEVVPFNEFLNIYPNLNQSVRAETLWYQMKPDRKKFIKILMDIDERRVLLPGIYFPNSYNYLNNKLWNKPIKNNKSTNNSFLDKHFDTTWADEFME